MAAHAEFFQYDDQVVDAVPVVLNVVDVSCCMDVATLGRCIMGGTLCSNC